MRNDPSSLQTPLRAGFLVFVLFCPVLRAVEEQRTWEHDGASYEGRAIVIDDRRVVIVRPDGQTKDLLRDNLSAKDEEYARAKGDFIAPMPPPTREIPGEVMKTLRDVRESLYLPEMDGPMWQIAENSPPLCYGFVKPVERIVDPLSARGVILLTDKQPIVLCVIDWVAISNGAYDAWCEALAEAASTTVDRVSVHVAHQHDTPGVDFSAAEILAKYGHRGMMFDDVFARDAIRRTAAAAGDAVKKSRRVSHIG